MKKQPISNVKKIVVLRSNAIGDFVFILPALFALRETYPEASITLLTKEWTAEFLKGREGPFDQVVALPYCPVINPGPVDERKLNDFFEKMQKEKFDLAVQLQGGGRESNPLVKKLGARMTFGNRTPDAVPLDYWIPFFYLHSETLRNLEVVALAGAYTKNYSPKIKLINSDLENSFKFVPENFGEFVVVHPGAGDPRRRWPMKNFAEICEYLQSLSYKVIIIGVSNECPDIKVLTDWMSEKPLVLVDKLSLGGLIGLISRAKFFIGNDSGPRHLAEALQTPNIGLYWALNVINAGPTFTTLNRPIISWQMECPVCKNDLTIVGHDVKGCDHRVSLLTKISVNQVKNEIDEIRKLTKENYGFHGEF